jgi:hypothetical protein
MCLCSCHTQYKTYTLLVQTSITTNNLSEEDAIRNLRNAATYIFPRIKDSEIKIINVKMRDAEL